MMGMSSKSNDHWESNAMGSIDLEILLSEITPESPCGGNMEYDAEFVEFEEKLKGTPEVKIGDDVAIKAQPPSWPNIQDCALELFSRTHDLRLAIALARAMLHNDSLPGLRDGLFLIKGLLDRYWDTVHPQLDPEDGYDSTQRINILMALSDREIMIRPLMETHLCSLEKAGCFNMRDIHIAMNKIAASDAEKKAAANMDMIEIAFAESDIEFLRNLRMASDEALQILRDIENSLIEKTKSNLAAVQNDTCETVDFALLQDILQEISKFLTNQLGKHPQRESRFQSAITKTNEPGILKDMDTQHVSEAKAKNTFSGLNSRKDIVRNLELICEYYEKNEPASPVPLLLKRAIALVEKNFLEIMQDLAPESLNQILSISGSLKGKS